MTEPTPTELADDLARWRKHGAVILERETLRAYADTFATALEAQLAETARLQAELTRRDTVIAGLLDPAGHIEEVAYADDIAEGGEEVPEDYERHYCDMDGEDWPCAFTRAITLASAGSSSALEAVKADTPAPPAFVNSVPNDGRYEYTSSSDCDGSDPYYRARVPAKHAEAGPWFPISAEDYAAASKNWRGDWLPVETEGESRG